jgi:hypothetical protein
MLKTISTITNALGALNYKGTWNASTNSPTLADGTGAKGDYYVVSTAGTQTFGGVQLFFGLGDWIAYNGAVWQRVEGGSDGNFANVTLTSTDAGATAAPLLDLYRDSASPAASDTLGEIEFNGEDSAGNKQTYGVIHGSILSPTSTAEQGQLHFETATAGALTEKMIIGTNNLVINEIGAVFNVRIEGDTDANLFTTDATNSRVGIGTISPASKLDVAGGDIRIDNGNLSVATSGKGITTGSAIPLGLGTNNATASATLLNSGGLSLGSTVDPGAANLFVGTSGNSGNYGRLTAKSATDDANTNVIYLENSAPARLFQIRSDGYFVTGAAANSPYNNTTGSVANVFVDSSGVLYRGTSSIKYKKNVQTATFGLSDVLKLRPVTYQGKSEKDAQKTFGGLIAEEVDEAGLGIFVDYANDGTPDALHYASMVSLLIKAIQDLNKKFDDYVASHP